MSKKNDKEVDFRRYVNYGLFTLAIIVFCLLASKLYNIYKDNNLSTSVLSRVVGTIQYDDIDNAIREFVSDDFVVISYTKSKDVRRLENAVKKIIVNNNLQSNFYYLDVTSLMLENDYIDKLNSKFKLVGNDKIEAVPAILYYKNGEFKKVLSSNKNDMMESDDLAKLIDEYEINQNER